MCWHPGTPYLVQEGIDYTLHCIPFLDIVESLKTREGRCRNCDDCSVCQTDCDIGVSGITITLKRQEEGIVFSYPYYKGYVPATICTRLFVENERAAHAIPQIAGGACAGHGWQCGRVELDQAIHVGPVACGT